LDPHDNSGILKYVRIEFPGYEISSGSEINGLTLCSVGDGTTIDYVQVSYSGDDAYEWFGGTVNARHLICLATEDDNFDTDLGYSGMVQYGIIARDSSIVDTDTANGFESDNDGDGSDNEPFTHAIFSNITGIGPSVSDTEPATLRPNHDGGSAMRIRRNSHLQVYNSVFVGFGRGLRLESESGWTAAQSDDLTVQHTVLAGIRNDVFKTDVADGASAVEDWFKETDPVNRWNSVIDDATELMLADPFNYTSRDFMPDPASVLLGGSYWDPALGFGDLDLQGPVSAGNYPNPFSGTTTIEITLDKASEVRAMVYDITGKLVANLYEGKMYAGTETLEFDATELPRGIYIGKVITDDKESTFKMIAR
jgi:hypothetical protein